MIRLTRYHALAFMVLCLLLAAALRLPDLPNAPPGLHYDEAANGILSADIGLRGDRPVFISSYTGKEVLFFYGAGGLMRLLGDSVFTLRLTAAYMGLLTVAVTYWLGREMLADRRVALIAAALLAVSFWHLIFSRLGFRAISQPLLQALTVAALFRGLRREQWRWFVLSGVFLGLTGYTYLAARLFPVLLVLGSLPLLFNSTTLRRRWPQLLLVAGVAFVVLLPLLGYFITNPNAFWVRITQVAPGTESSTLTLADSLLKSLGMYFLVGDTFWRFNLPGRPLFNWFWGALLVVGWIICIVRYRRFPYDWQRAAVALLIFVPLVMLLPTALATNELVPSNLRAIGLIPFIFFLPAIGTVILLHDLERRFRFPPVVPAVLFIGLLVLFSGGLATRMTYFQEWAPSRTLLYEADGDLVAVAEYLNTADLGSRPIYLAALHYRHPTVAFTSEAYPRIKWLPESRALVFPAEGEAVVIYPHNSPEPAWARPFLAHATPAPGSESILPRDAFTAYTLSAPLELDIAQRADADFGGTITLLGYDMGTARAGETLSLTLFWRVTGTPNAAYTPFVHLEDVWGHRWSQEETFAYPAEQWSPGETIIQHVEVDVPPGAPADDYRLRLGLFDAASDTRLPRLDENGRYAGDAFIIEDVAIAAEGVPAPLPVPPVVVSQTVIDGLQLRGYERGPATSATGEPWGFALWWLAEEPLPPLTTQLAAVSGDGSRRVLLEGQPVHNTYPFAAWSVPQFLIDRQLLSIPTDFRAGDYRLALAIVDDAGQVLTELDMGPLSVTETERTFTPPTVETAVNAIFSGEIELLGYDLAPGVQPNSHDLTLVWQALEQTPNDYTVFVHVLNADGTCCLWQDDSMPRQNTYPTSRWLPGEVVTDSYAITLPPDTLPGSYALEVGLYIAETGRRLQIAGQEGDALGLRPLRVE